MLSAIAVIGALWQASISVAQGFQRFILTSDASSAFGMAVADLDGDGDLDAATTNFSSGSALWIETLPGEPAIPHTLDIAYGSLRGISSGDFDSDGDADLAVAAYQEDRFLWLENRRLQGADTFLTHVLRSPSNGAWATIAGDLDLDGDADLVTTEFLGNVSRIFLQESGQLVESAAFSMHSPMDATIVDYDGDGDRDVVAANYNDEIVWIENAADTWVSHPLDFGDSLASIGAADLDNDGDIDLIAPRYTNSMPVTWWERTAAGFTAHNLPGLMSQVRDVGTADFDEDGDFDIVATAQDGVFRWWENMGNRIFTQRSADPGSHLYNLTIVDYDQDGDVDVVVADHGDSRLLFYQNMMGVPSIVTGFVRAAATGQPVANVLVRLTQNGVASITDTSGHYILPCGAGQYDLRTRHLCWNDTLIFGVVVVAGETTAVDLSIVRPIVDVQTSSLNLVAQNGQLTTVPLPVANMGDGILTVTATATGNYPGDPWLSIVPDSAVISAGESFDFEVQVAPDTSYSQNWDYAGLLELRTNSCPDSEIQVAVVVYVLDTPEPRDALPIEIALHEVYPNPFNAVATVSFDLPQPSHVEVKMFDVTGRLVQTLLRGMFIAGEHAVAIDGTNLASGVYMIEFDADRVHLTRKALLLK